jgi:hypothetical protein
MMYEHCPLCQSKLITSKGVDVLECPKINIFEYFAPSKAPHFYQSDKVIGIYLNEYVIHINLTENKTNILFPSKGPEATVCIPKILIYKSEEDFKKQIQFYLLYS